MPAAAKKSAAKIQRVKAVPVLKSQEGREMSAKELHQNMLAYGKKVAATKESAVAFLRSIGAPIKAASR